MKKYFSILIIVLSYISLNAQSACVEITKNSNTQYSFALKGSSVPVTVTDYTFDIDIQQKNSSGNNVGSVTRFQAALGDGADITLNNTTTSVGLVPSSSVNITLAPTAVSVSFSFFFNEIAYQGVSGVRTANFCGIVDFVLPVELLNFQAQNQDKINLLTWQTASERDNKGFDIQRSSEGKNFETLGFVKGHGTTQEKQSYSFIDEHPLSISYYRLRQIDLDGKESYSKTVSVTMDLKTSFKIYPNPTNAVLNLQFDSEKEQDTQIQLFDNLGRTVHTYNFTSKMGNNHLFFETQSFPAGHYALIIKQGDLIVVNKIILN